jgi:hypothetical protein
LYGRAGRLTAQNGDFRRGQDGLLPSHIAAEQGHVGLAGELERMPGGLAPKPHGKRSRRKGRGAAGAAHRREQ